MSIVRKGLKDFRIECGKFAARYPEHEAARLLAEGEAIIEELEADLEAYEAAKPAVQGAVVGRIDWDNNGAAFVEFYPDRDLPLGAELYTHPVAAGLPSTLPMETAPRDGTMLRLLVRFTEHPTEDAELAWTIGANNYEGDGEDVWQFAGWCWEHDHFTEGKGGPIGWLPMLAAAPQPPGDGAGVTDYLIEWLSEMSKHANSGMCAMTVEIRNGNYAKALLNVISSERMG